MKLAATGAHLGIALGAGAVLAAGAALLLRRRPAKA
ncbi:LPXTG cell wall anchor domain-containing protein [Schaalia hyovaginalis]